jgi:hypothetical protein
MNSLTAREIKRRGMGAVDGPLGGGPVYVIKNNRPRYVVLREEDGGKTQWTFSVRSFPPLST